MLIVANHQSYLDPVVLGAFLPRPVNFVAKSELFDNSAGRWAMRHLYAFPIHQGRGDIGALRETIGRLRHGQVVAIFPEGARTPDGRIHPFQRGVGLIVRRAGVPVIPVVITGAYRAWPIYRRVWQAEPIRVRFGAAMRLDGLGSDAAVADAVELELRQMLLALNAPVACPVPLDLWSLLGREPEVPPVRPPPDGEWDGVAVVHGVAMPPGPGGPDPPEQR